MPGSALGMFQLVPLFKPAPGKGYWVQSMSLKMTVACGGENFCSLEPHGVHYFEFSKSSVEVRAIMLFGFISN